MTVAAEAGDSDPLLAIQDALARFDADEIVVVTRPEEEASWLEQRAADDAPRRARTAFRSGARVVARGRLAPLLSYDGSALVGRQRGDAACPAAAARGRRACRACRA